MDTFQVAIVGGGLTGLTLALHMEKLGIKWVIIESHDEIAPQQGASIGLAPNGLRVLDQLGCYDDVAQRACPIEHVTARNASGAEMFKFRMLEPLRAKQGFDLSFTERQIVLDVLHQKIRGKDNIFTGQRVSGIKQLDDGVEISTETGRTFTADIAIGADGIRSFVRSEMWRIASDDDPSIFGSNPGADVSTEYGCIFGLSNRTKGLTSGEEIQVHDKGVMIGIAVGPEDTLYWFVFFAYPKTHKGLDFPRHSKEEEKALVAGHGHKMVKPGITFNDVYDNSIITHITALPHHIFDRWHYKRIICLGDSVHKFNPVNGQGGCSALESSLCFVDNLYAALDAHKNKSGGESNPKLSNEEIEGVFRKTTEMRLKRAGAMVEESMTMMRLTAWSNWLFRFIDTYVVRFVPASTLVGLMFASAVGGYVSNTLPPPTPKYAMGKEAKV